MKPETVVTAHAANLETLVRAARNGDLALLECVDRFTGELVAVVCAVGFDGTDCTFTPFAALENGNPFERWMSPAEADGDA